MPNATQVFITGGAGFVGVNLVRRLLAAGYAVTVFDNFSVGRHEDLAGLPLRIIEGDILDAPALAAHVPGHQAIVHLAAQTGVPGSVANPRRDCEVNVTGTLNLLEAARAAEVSRFVFASSNAPLGRQTPPATEDKAPLPVSPYGASKLAGEGYCLAYHGTWELGTVILRFANLYGPYSAQKNSVVARFCKDLLAGRQLQIHGDGGQTRDFIFIDDLTAAIQLALETALCGEVFQIATGVETTVYALAEKLGQLSGQGAELSYTAARQGDVRQNYSAVDKAYRLLGWSPQTSLDEGLAKTWAWFVAQAAAGQ